MSFWTGLAGSILVPVAGAVLTRLSHEIDPVKDEQDLFFRLMLAHGAVGVGSYVASQRATTDAGHDFAIGGASAEALVVALAVYASTRTRTDERSAQTFRAAPDPQARFGPFNRLNFLSGGADVPAFRI